MGLSNFIWSLGHRVNEAVTEPPDEDTAILQDIVAYKYSISNKFVDVYFNEGVYAEAEAALEAADLRITNLVAGGVTAISIASIKKPDHYLSASATAVTGGDTIIRVFLTLTGTPDGTESYQIRPVEGSVFNLAGVAMLSHRTTGVIPINITPASLWDAKLPSTVTVTGNGASAVVDVMGVENLAQTTDADRPLYYRQSAFQFDSANSEFFTGAAHANFQKQQANDFTLFVEDLYVNNNQNSSGGYIFAYFNGSNNHGISLHQGFSSNRIRFLIMDNVTANDCYFSNFEDQKGSFFIVNESGILRIYDENGNIGKVGSTAIGTITYTGITLRIGRRETQTTNYFNGEWSKMAWYNQALTSAQRLNILRNRQKVQNPTITLTKYLYPVVNGSIDSSAKDTMQVFPGNSIVKIGTTLYLYYCANAADGDIDRNFLATKEDDESTFTSFTKVLDGGLPKVILDASGVNGTFDENEVFLMSVIVEGDTIYQYYLGNQIGATPAYTIGLATADISDPTTFTKQGQKYTDGVLNIIRFCFIKWGENDYRGIVTTSATGGDTNNFSYDYITSTDGVTIIKVGSISSKLAGIILVTCLVKVGDVAYLICTADSRDSDPSAGSMHVVYSTKNFIDYVYQGILNTKFEPNERGVGGISPFVREDSIDLYYSYFKNQNKTAANGGEGYTSIKMATLNSLNMGAANVVNVYPPWVKFYWPLNAESASANVFSELIAAGTATFSGVPQWTVDGLNMFDFTGTGMTFSAINIAPYIADLCFKMRVKIVLTGTINLFSIGTDIVIQLVSGNLRVALNNATKDYITTADIAKPTGITDPGDDVYIGFIWQGGALKICVGNDTNVSVVQTVNNAMTDIANSGATPLVCSGATIEAGRIWIGSGQTDDQWINTDL